MGEPNGNKLLFNYPMSLFTISLLTAVSFYYSRFVSPLSTLCLSSPLPCFTTSFSFQNVFYAVALSSLFLFLWAYTAKLDIQQQNINCMFTKRDLNSNYVNTNHQSLYFPLCLLKSLLICTTLSLFCHRPLRLFRWGSSIFQACLCFCVWGWVEPC